jgi:hypothetical protein
MGYYGKPSLVSAADEQAEPNGLRGTVHVTIVGLSEMSEASSFNPPAATWVFLL